MPKNEFEALATLLEAADRLNIKVWLLRRSARKGEFPTYRLNGRIRVRLSEVEAFIQRSRVEGGQ